MWLKRLFERNGGQAADLQADPTSPEAVAAGAVSSGDPIPDSSKAQLEITVDTNAIVDRATVPSDGPTYAGKPIPFYPNRGLAVAAADPLALLETQSELIRRLQQASGFNKAQFDALLLPVLINYASFVHLLPASENHHHWDIGGLLRHGLECCFYAARKCEAAVFALDFTPSQRKKLEPRYRMCAILGALMHDLGKPLFDVGAIDESGELRWDPHVEALNAWLVANKLPHYFITWRHGPRGMKHEAFTTAAVYRIIPESTLRWIADGGSQKPFSEMLLAMTTRHDDKNVLVEIIRHADQASVSRDIAASRERLAETGQGGLRSLAARLVRSVHDKILSGEWRLNRIGNPVWYTEDGIVAMFPEITRQMIESLRAGGDQGLAYDSMQVLEILSDYGFTIRNTLPNGSFRHTWEARLEGEDRGKEFNHKVQVIRFSAETIIPAVTVLPAPVKVEWMDLAGNPVAPAADAVTSAAAVLIEADAANEPAEAPQEPIVLANGQLPSKPTLDGPDAHPAEQEAVGAPGKKGLQKSAQGSVPHEQQFPHLYPADMQAIELPEVVGGRAEDPVLPSASPAGEGELEITDASPADDPDHPYFRDRQNEKDYAQEIRDEAKELLSSTWPPATADEANIWLKGKRPLGIFLQDVAAQVRKKKLNINDAIFDINDRINLKFPQCLQGLGADEYELRTELIEIGWLERDPATPTSQNVTITHPKTSQPVACVRLSEDMSVVFRLIVGDALTAKEGSHVLPPAAPSSNNHQAEQGGSNGNPGNSAGGLGPYLSSDDIGKWTTRDFTIITSPEPGAVLRHAVWLFLCDAYRTDTADGAEALLDVDERMVKASITDFISQHSSLTRSTVLQLCVDKQNPLFEITQYANSAPGRWELIPSTNYQPELDAQVAEAVRRRVIMEKNV